LTASALGFATLLVTLRGYLLSGNKYMPMSGTLGPGNPGHLRPDHRLGLPLTPRPRKDPPGLFPGPGAGGVSPGLDRQRDRTPAGGESPPLDEATRCARVLEVLRSAPEWEDDHELLGRMEAGAVSATQHPEADE
nr:hypothetical protein [Burkholderiales bacterium]